MQNYRIQKRNYGAYRSPQKKRSVNRWILIIIAVIVVAFIGRLAYTRSSSQGGENKNTSDDIQTLESLLKNANVNSSLINGATISDASKKITCEKPYSAISTTDKIVALTFDTSPTISEADTMLKTLKDAQAPATFFMTGEFAETEAATAKKIADAGFPIGNHSDTHADFAKLSSSSAQKEISEAAAKIKAATGLNEIKFFRPPLGSLGTGDTISQLITKEGYCTMLWTIDAEDWKKEATDQTVLTKVTKNIKPGAIIMMQFGHETIAKALPQVLSSLKQEGYRFVLLSDFFSPPALAVTPR